MTFAFLQGISVGAIYEKIINKALVFKNEKNSTRIL